MELKMIPGTFTVCKILDPSQADLTDAYCFLCKTDTELSLVCRTQQVPAQTLEREDGWRAIRIQGKLDFSLVGVLSHIAGILAEKQIGVFAVSTFDTDYFLIKSADFQPALQALRLGGHRILS
ncbi:MAG: ACT domain-containing protein [Clostridiales bacterium]|nr:ACT domain-containing protein [Clostridiales bacterium]